MQLAARAQHGVVLSRRRVGWCMCARPPPTADVAPGGVVVCVPTGGTHASINKLARLVAHITDFFRHAFPCTKGRTGTPLAYDSHAGTRPRGVGPAAWCCRRRKPTNRCCGRANQSRYDLHTHFAAETRSAALVDFLRFAAELLAPTPTASTAPTAPAMPPTRTAIGLDST